MTNERSFPPAKLNLFLDIVSKREDGYHNIESVMQAISVFDSLELSFEKEAGRRLDSNLSFPENQKNLCWKAADAFWNALGMKQEAMQISLQKGIPMGAGMGGGSSDAASTLMMLNRHYGNPLSMEELSSLAAGIGADVPFFLLGGTAKAEGIGDKLQGIVCPIKLYYVVCKPELSLSTAEMYKRIDESDRGRSGNFPQFVHAVEEGNFSQIALSLYNVFEEAAFELAPEIRDMKESLLSFGAANALMTGSGSAVFGLFDSRESADAAFVKMKSHCSSVYLAESL